MTTARAQGLPAFSSWVSDLARLHTRALSRVARAGGLSAADALDAVQEAFETFLELPEARTLVGREQDSRRLLSAFVRNVARNMRRRAFRRLPHEELGERPEIADDMPGVDELLARAEEEFRLMGCVSIEHHNREFNGRGNRCSPWSVLSLIMGVVKPARAIF